MDKTHAQKFELKNKTLFFDREKLVLLCASSDDGKNIWAKKMPDIADVVQIIEDEKNYYLSCEYAEASGYCLAVDKANGSSLWYIPGRPFFNVVFEGFLYLIFIDEKDFYYLIKVERTDGSKVWFHRIAPDLAEYSFRNDRILLVYASGTEEKLSPQTGLPLR